MSKKTNNITKVLVQALAVAVILFLGGWALTALAPNINWSMQAIAGIAALVASVIGGALMYSGAKQSDNSPHHT